MVKKNNFETLADIKDRMDRIFEATGYKKVYIDNCALYLDSSKGLYHRIDYIGSPEGAFVVETAAHEDAMENHFEPSKAYPVSLGEQALLVRFRDDLTI